MLGDNNMSQEKYNFIFYLYVDLIVLRIFHRNSDQNETEYFKVYKIYGRSDRAIKLDKKTVFFNRKRLKIQLFSPATGVMLTLMLNPSAKYGYINKIPYLFIFRRFQCRRKEKCTF